MCLICVNIVSLFSSSSFQGPYLYPWCHQSSLNIFFTLPLLFPSIFQHTEGHSYSNNCVTLAISTSFTNISEITNEPKTKQTHQLAPTHSQCFILSHLGAPLFDKSLPPSYGISKNIVLVTWRKVYEELDPVKCSYLCKVNFKTLQKSSTLKMAIELDVSCLMVIGLVY